jgi:hypothetical protein
MEIEGFEAIISSVTLAKELRNIDRFDIVRKHFFDTLSWDSTFENLYGVITTIFSGFFSDYDDGDEEECMIFTDDYISRYYEIAWEYGRSHNVRHDENPYVVEAESEVSRRLSYCYSMGYKLLGYTKTNKTARQSKLIVSLGVCDCDSHDSLAYGLIQLYKFFSEKCVEFESRKAVTAANADIMSREEVIAA